MPSIALRRDAPPSGGGPGNASKNPPQGGWLFHNLPNFPYGKGGFDVSGGGGYGVTGCHHTDEPRTVLAVILVGVARRGVANDPPPAKGGFNAARWSPASLGTVR